MIKLNSIIRIALYALYAAFIYLNPVHASNFVCAQDLDGNGDIDGIGENASCQTIGTEQFCSIGAQVCNNISNTYSCPTAGKSCVDVGGIQKCSINPCIDLDVTVSVSCCPHAIIFVITCIAAAMAIL
jgi:hypothetical protein